MKAKPEVNWIHGRNSALPEEWFRRSGSEWQTKACHAAILTIMKNGLEKNKNNPQNRSPAGRNSDYNEEWIRGNDQYVKELPVGRKTPTRTDDGSSGPTIVPGPYYKVWAAKYKKVKN